MVNLAFPTYCIIWHSFVANPSLTSSNCQWCRDIRHPLLMEPSITSMIRNGIWCPLLENVVLSSVSVFANASSLCSTRGTCAESIRMESLAWCPKSSRSTPAWCFVQPSGSARIWRIWLSAWCPSQFWDVNSNDPQKNTLKYSPTFQVTRRNSAQRSYGHVAKTDPQHRGSVVSCLAAHAFNGCCVSP